jgi:hypothetical protein
MSEDNSTLIKTPYDDPFLDLFNGKLNIYGRNDQWLKKRIYQLERVECTPEQQRELEKNRVEMGMTREGNKKPRCCWAFIHHGQCNHNASAMEYGDVIGARWHPGEKEAAYLKEKTSK